MTIRPELPGDEAAIHTVNEAAFGGRDEATLVDQLRQNGDFVFSLVATDGPSVVGHALFTRLVAPAGSLALAPVAVLPDYQNHGIGSRLIQEGLDRAKAAGWRRVFVLGEPAYYQRFGFSLDIGERFRSPYAGPYFMGLCFEADAMRADDDDEIVYPAPFQHLA